MTTPVSTPININYQVPQNLLNVDIGYAFDNDFNTITNTQPSPKTSKTTDPPPNSPELNADNVEKKNVSAQRRQTL